MTLKPWREIAEPHSDVREGKFQQAEFAADLSRVHAGSANPEYQDPALFFQRTFITEGMRLLLDSVVKRLVGQGGDPVIQLQTAFGGGKTHTMLAVYHLVNRNGGDAPVSDLQGVSVILDAAGVTELPRTRIAVLDGIKSSPNQPVVRDGQSIRTLWGDLAWQLGAADGYALVAAADASGTSPGKEVLADLLGRYAPCIILIDELVAYVRQFEEGKALTGGSFDSNLSFVQALTEALKAVPTAVLLASLPESVKEAGGQCGEKALAALAHYFGRTQALWKPVATEEAFEIVRRRLFSNINDKLAMESVCRAFADYYIENRNRVLKDNELVISEWAPIHLAKVLKDWFWKDDAPDANALNVWQQSCQQLYLPRLKDDTVFKNTIDSGAASREFFGLAQGKETDGGTLRYVGFSYGKRESLIFDLNAALLLIEPHTAAAYMAARRGEQEAAYAVTANSENSESAVTTRVRETPPSKNFNTSASPPSLPTSANKRFHASINLDPMQAKRQFADLVDEVVQHFTTDHNVKVEITIDISAHTPTSFNADLQRAVKENCKVLKFKSAAFEAS